MKLSIVLLVTILCISFCIEYVTSDRDGILQAFPEEDLTEGVAKTDAKDAEKIHRTLEESSKKVMTVKLSQDLADKGTKSTSISPERAEGGMKLLLSMGSDDSSSDDSSSGSGGNKAGILDVLKLLVDDKPSLRMIFQAFKKAKLANDNCLKANKDDKKCKSLEKTIKKVYNYLLQFAKDQFNVKVASVEEFDDSEKREKEKEEAKKSEQKQKELGRVQEENQKKEAFEKREEAEKQKTKEAEESSKRASEESKKSRASSDKSEQAEKAAAKAANKALQEERDAAAALREAEKAKNEADVKLFQKALRAKQQEALRRSQALKAAQSKQAAAKAQSDLLKKKMVAQEQKEKKTMEENEKAGEQRKKIAASSEKRMADLSNGITEMMKKQQELLSRKMSLQNEMASNMKGAEEKLKKDHAAYRKKAEKKASSAADKQVKDMKEIMDGFIKKLAANMPKQALAPVAATRPAAPVAAPVAAPQGNNDISVKKPNGESTVAVPGTTLHIECNGCGGGGSDSNSDNSDKKTKDEKDIEEDKKSDLEAKVGTAVDNAVNKIVGIHKSNNAGRTLVGDPELDKTKETLQQQQKELESVKGNLDKQKEMNNQLSQKNLEKEKKIEQMST